MIFLFSLSILLPPLLQTRSNVRPARKEEKRREEDFVCREKEVWDFWVFVRDPALDSEIWGSVESSRVGVLSLTLLQGISPLHRNKMHFYTRPILDCDTSSLTSYHMYKT